ncbi:MAG TPA: hypothetical protein VFX96_15320 [Pyrinomonadaceae bacterium]|nr:hypothetical protein [Pyrinomonadaceae bacterium]
MYCPRCSQQQPTSEVRFCTRCGFPLAGVARLLDGGGESAEVEAAATGRRLTKRQRGIREGLIAMVAGVLFFIVAALLTAYKEDFFVLLPIVAIVFVGGLVRLIHAALVEDDVPANADARSLKAAAHTAKPTVALEARRAASELPPARGFAANEYARPRADTSEMAAPASVTENTTRTLEEEKR